jgi:hypothetical protein
MSGTNKLKRGVIICVALLAAGWLTAGPAAAQNGKGKGKGKVIDSRIIHELRETNELLAKANHDYHGYRVKAMHQIREAIHDLQHHKGHSKQVSKSGTGSGLLTQAGKQGNGKAALTQSGGTQTRSAGLTNREPQDVSDAQLHRAIKRLRHVVHQLENHSGHHHREALHHVRRAIHDLEKALKVA